MVSIVAWNTWKILSLVSSDHEVPNFNDCSPPLGSHLKTSAIIPPVPHSDLGAGSKEESYKLIVINKNLQICYKDKYDRWGLLGNLRRAQLRNGSKKPLP